MYSCRQCRASSPAYVSPCPRCGQWNTLAPVADRDIPSDEPVRLADLPDADVARIATGMAEVDRVLGGGLVRSCVTLLSGDPGIGKSTLLLQVAHAVGAEGPVLYVTGEEPRAAIKARSRRLGFGGADDESDVVVMESSDLARIEDEVRKIEPVLLILDSAQTMRLEDTDPGSVVALKKLGPRMSELAMQTGLAILVIAHVTKDGDLAGPRHLEHMVDVALHCETTNGSPVRMLYARKNRHGSTEEKGMLEMTSRGLVDVSNPSEWFLRQRPHGEAGSVIVATCDSDAASRAVLVEIQALVYPNAAKRQIVATGVDAKRCHVVLAAMERKLGLSTSSSEVYINVVGGIAVTEHSVDLGIAMAVASSLLQRPVPDDMVIFGQVGLMAEVRDATSAELRIREARLMAFARVLCGPHEAIGELMDLTVLRVKSLEDAVASVFGEDAIAQFIEARQ